MPKAIHFSCVFFAVLMDAISRVLILLHLLNMSEYSGSVIMSVFLRSSSQ